MAVARVLIGDARVGMLVAKDVYSADQLKLISSGTVLTDNHLARLKKHLVREIEIADGRSKLVYLGTEPNRKGAAIPSGDEKEDLRAAIQRLPLFANFAEEHTTLILQHSKKVKLGAHTLLFREKEQGHTFFMILRGSVKIYTRSDTGEEKILSVLTAGEGLGELSLIDGKPRSASALTLEETELLVLSRDSFLKLLKGNFEMIRSLMEKLADRLRKTNEHVNDLAFCDPHTRVVKNLIQLARRFGQRSEEYVLVKMPLNYDELSQMAGVQKRVLGDVIRQLEVKQVLRMHEDSFELILSRLRS